MQAATYTIKAGDTLRPTIALEQFKDGQFEIEILAPNGFYRRFTGNVHEPPAVVVTTLQQRNGKPTGALELHLHNPSRSAQKLTISDNSYGAAVIAKPLEPGATETVTIPLESSHQWYDLTVQAVDGNALARFAGRIETGRATQTDPLMGRV
jgi:phospholipase C